MTPKGGARTGAGRKPRPGYNRHNIYISDEAWKLLEKRAKHENVSISAIIEQLARAQAERDVEGNGFLHNGEG